MNATEKEISKLVAIFSPARVQQYKSNWLLFCTYKSRKTVIFLSKVRKRKVIARKQIIIDAIVITHDYFFENKRLYRCNQNYS